MQPVRNEQDTQLCLVSGLGVKWPSIVQLSCYGGSVNLEIDYNNRARQVLDKYTVDSGQETFGQYLVEVSPMTYYCYNLVRQVFHRQNLLVSYLLFSYQILTLLQCQNLFPSSQSLPKMKAIRKKAMHNGRPDGKHNCLVLS